MKRWIAVALMIGAIALCGIGGWSEPEGLKCPVAVLAVLDTTENGQQVLALMAVPCQSNGTLSARRLNPGFPADAGGVLSGVQPYRPGSTRVDPGKKGVPAAVLTWLAELQLRSDAQRLSLAYEKGAAGGSLVPSDSGDGYLVYGVERDSGRTGARQALGLLAGQKDWTPLPEEAYRQWAAEYRIVPVLLQLEPVNSPAKSGETPRADSAAPAIAAGWWESRGNPAYTLHVVGPDSGSSSFRVTLGRKTPDTFETLGSGVLDSKQTVRIPLKGDSARNAVVQFKDGRFTLTLTAVLSWKSGVPEQVTIDRCIGPELVRPTIAYGWYQGYRTEILKDDDNGRTYLIRWGYGTATVPASQLTIEADPTVETGFLARSQLEAYADGHFKSDAGRYLWADLWRQNLYVFQKQQGHWRLEKRVVIAAGKNRTPTLRGTFTIYTRGPRFGGTEGALNFLRYSGPYMIHSLPVDRGGRITDYTLGKPASHGCIRCSMEDSLWLYRNIPDGTPLWVN